MKKSTYLTGILLTIASSSWAAPQCVPWDYARIKDANEEELVQLSCSSQKKAMDNFSEAMHASASGSPRWKSDADDAGHAGQVCSDQARQANKVLQEKFGKKADCSAQ